MNDTELKAHRTHVMTNGRLAAHLKDDHGITEVPRAKTKQIELHDSIDHSTIQVPAATTQADRDAAVLAGVTRAKGEAPAANQPKPKPTARQRKTTETVAVKDELAAKRAANGKAPAKRRTATKQPETPVQTAKRTRATAKQQEQAQPAASNGTTPREHNQELARQLLNAIVKEFAGVPLADQQKVANWLHPLPTGGEGAGWLRWWPADFPRPTSAGWKKPE